MSAVPGAGRGGGRREANHGLGVGVGKRGGQD